MYEIYVLGDYIRRNGIGSMPACPNSFYNNPFSMWIVNVVTLMFEFYYSHNIIGTGSFLFKLSKF